MMYFESSYIEDREKQGAGLASLIRRLVEKEMRYDYEIAEVLRISQASVGRLRKQLNIPRADGFKRRFENTYGAGATEKFKRIVESPAGTLSDAARHFGFSREYARQVYKKIYSEPYTRSRERKREIRQSQTAGVVDERRRYAFELERRLKKLKLPYYISRKRRGRLFVINGHKAVMSVAPRARRRGGNARYYEAAVPSAADRYGCRILIFRCGSNGACFYYIIPRDAIAESGKCLLPESPLNKSKYGNYMEAWHLFRLKSPSLGAAPSTDVAIDKWEAAGPERGTTVVPAPLRAATSSG